MEEQSKREVVINSDWITTLGVALILMFSFLCAASDFRHITRGKFAAPVSFGTLFLAVYAFVLAYWSVGRRLLRGGFILLGVGESIRIGAFYLHASDHVQYLAAVNALVLGMITWTTIFIYAVQWLRGVVQIRNRQ